MDVLLSGSRWFEAGVVAGVLAVLGTLGGQRGGASTQATLLKRLHLLFALVVASQALGHITATTIRSGRGTLTTTTPLPWLWGIGLVYLIPTLLLLVLVLRGSLDDATTRKRVLWLDGFLAVALAVAIFPGPLAIPAILGIVLLRRDTPATRGWVVGLSAATYGVMFVASLFFDGP